ncbi:MAG TPA: phosphotransferase [Polyangia bacterium]|nr:phosphotransferase [Polyangia bacterium]
MDDGVAQLASVIAAHVGKSAKRDLPIWGSREPGTIAAEIARFCRDELAGTVARPLFYETSQGSVAGVELADGRRVVVKAHHPAQDLAGLHESVRVQMHLASRGIYATTVCGGPAPIGRTLATVEAYVTAGVTRDGHDPAVRAELARALFVIVGACRPLVAGSSLPPHYFAQAYAGLWPDGSDFASGSREAERIDDLARAARARMEPTGELVIGHGDWRVQQVLFDGGRVVAAHDWISLCKEREPALVGFTAFAFCVDWSRTPVPVSTLDDARGFVADYEAARGRAFSVAERRLCGALFAYSYAYTARCFCGRSDGPRTFGDMVASHGSTLMEL